MLRPHTRAVLTGYPYACGKSHPSSCLGDMTRPKREPEVENTACCNCLRKWSSQQVAWTTAYQHNLRLKEGQETTPCSQRCLPLSCEPCSNMVENMVNPAATRLPRPLREIDPEPSLLLQALVWPTCRLSASPNPGWSSFLPSTMLGLGVRDLGSILKVAGWGAFRCKALRSSTAWALRL